MTEYRKYALFQLVVVGAAAIAVLAILAVTGRVLPALAGFALLALLGLRRLVLKGQSASPIRDERDEAIHRRATIAGHVALWLALVAWGVAMPLLYGESGSVPLAWVAPVVWVGWWLVTCVQSVTILVLDGRGS